MAVTPKTIGRVVDTKLASGTAPAALVQWLTGQGVPQHAATEAVEKGQARQHIQLLKKQATRRIALRLAIGIGVFVVGVAITVGTYLAADPGETFTVAYGAMVVGVLALLQSMWASFKVKRAVNSMLAQLA